MAKNRWQLKLINPVEAVEVSVRFNWALALQDLKRWAAKDLVQAMTFGGLGIEGIAQTPFYRFISSTEGLSQLGIQKSDPPRLLEAYAKTFKVSTSRTTLLLRFGDVALLKTLTPHPDTGNANLQIESWLEWILEGKSVPGFGYIPRDKLPQGTQKRIRLNAPLGGLMLPAGEFGSTGSWSFPEEFLNYDVRWLEANKKKIQKAIFNQMAKFLTARSR